MLRINVLCSYEFVLLYREPGSNRHAHHWAKDFKSFLSTYSNIAARLN